MGRRRAPASGLQPPNLPAELAPLAPPVLLSDEDSYSAVVIADADLTATRAVDVSLDQVVCRRVRLTQAELERAQLSDVQLDTCDLAGAALTRPQLSRVALVGCRLLGTVLLSARLEHVLIQRGNAEALRCWNATLKAVRFERCSLRGASFTGVLKRKTQSAKRKIAEHNYTRCSALRSALYTYLRRWSWRSCSDSSSMPRKAIDAQGI